MSFFFKLNKSTIFSLLIGSFALLVTLLFQNCGGSNSSKANENQSLEVPADSLCSFASNGTVTLVGNNNEVTAYLSQKPEVGQLCQSEQRKCINGTLNGSFGNSSCSEQIVLKEYFNITSSLDLSRTTGRFFLTSQESDMLNAPLKDDFVKTNNTYTIFKTALPNTVPLYRYYNAGSTYHFYLAGTIGQNRPDLPGFSNDPDVGFVYPANASKECPTGTSEVSRFFFSSVTGESRHRFSTDPVIKNRLIAKAGWVYEKAGFCANAVNVEPTLVEPPATENLQGYSSPSFWIDSPLMNRIFFTRSTSEISTILANGFRIENGLQTYSNFNRNFKVFPSGSFPGTVALYRYFSSVSSSHVYSSLLPATVPLQNEGIVGYTRELIAGKCPINSVEVHNIFLPSGTNLDNKPRNLYWTKSQVDTYKTQYTSVNGRDDGIAFCAFN